MTYQRNKWGAVTNAVCDGCAMVLDVFGPFGDHVRHYCAKCCRMVNIDGAAGAPAAFTLWDNSIDAGRVYRAPQVNVKLMLPEPAVDMSTQHDKPWHGSQRAVSK